MTAGGEADYLKGIDLIRQGKHRLAEPILEAFIAETKDFPRREHARMLLGFVKGHLDDWSGAVKCFHDVMVNDIECLPAYTALGHAHLMAAEGEKAIEVFRIAVQKDPKNPQARHGLGWALLETGADIDEALYQAQEALRLNPNSPAVRDTVGWALYRRGEIEAAAEQLEEAARLDPDHPVILAHRREVRETLLKMGARKPQL